MSSYKDGDIKNKSLIKKFEFLIKRRLSLFLIASILIMFIIYFFNKLNIFNNYIMQIINVSLIYVILAVSLNLINGFTGLFSIGHMGFAAIGAYVSATITTLILKIRPDSFGNYLIFIIAILIGGISSFFVGILIGFPSLKVKGDYLAIITLAFGEIIRTILNNINYVGGPRGLLGIPKFSNFIIIYISTLLTIVIIRNIVFSSHGRALLSIRENEVASELLGINITKYKIISFAIGAFFAGIAGGLLCHLLQIAHPTQFGFLGSILVLIMVYAGGMGSISGSVIAAFVLTFLSEGLRILLGNLSEILNFPIGDQWRMVLYSLLLIFIMLFRSEGLMGMKEFKFLIPEEEESHAECSKN
ncbi:MAG: branched-chain amino acid ABC transporter permease [Spirochaetes bacterium]|nr:branched-chain amino acid ABC transporter permease [Spirochaetota bacterium]